MLNRFRRLMVVALSVTITLGLLSRPPVRADGTKPNPQTKAGNKKKVEPTAGKKPDKPAKDPFAVPEGSLDDVVAFLTRMRLRRVRSIAELRKTYGAISKAADRILGSTKATEAQRQLAILAKFSAISVNARFAVSPVTRLNAKTSLVKFAEKYKDDKNAAVRLLARGELLKDRAERIQKSDRKQQKQLVVDSLNYIRQKEGALRNKAGTVLTIARLLESSGARETAAEIYTGLAVVFSKSDDPRLKEYAPKMEGAARRVMLLGNSIKLKGQTIDGKPFHWEDYKGKVVLVDFWATWCGPCIGELPNVKKNYALYHKKGFDVVGISLDRAKDRLETFIKDKKIPWTNLFGQDKKHQGWDNPIATYYGVTAIPTVLLVDQNGKVISMNARGPVLGQLLKKTLGEPIMITESKKDTPDSSKKGKQ